MFNETTINGHHLQTLTPEQYKAGELPPIGARFQVVDAAGIYWGAFRVSSNWVGETVLVDICAWSGRDV
jgi:hypothetical protein